MNPKCPAQFLVLVLLCFGPVWVIQAQEEKSSLDWPEFRGPAGNGHAVGAQDLPTEFNDQQNLIWKSELPGRAWSSPVFADDQIWLTTAIEHQATAEELEAKKQEAPNAEGHSAFSKIDLKALKLDRETGELEAAIDLFTIDSPPVIHSLNSFVFG